MPEGKGSVRRGGDREGGGRGGAWGKGGGRGWCARECCPLTLNAPNVRIVPASTRQMGSPNPALPSPTSPSLGSFPVAPSSCPLPPPPQT